LGFIREALLRLIRKNIKWEGPVFKDLLSPYPPWKLTVPNIREAGKVFLEEAIRTSYYAMTPKPPEREWKLPLAFSALTGQGKTTSLSQIGDIKTGIVPV
jgi:hypothetical protein